MQHRRITYILFAFLVLVMPEYALAYIGPGAGVTAIGTVVALLGAVFLAIVGFIWYPFKRFLSKRKENNSNKKEENRNDLPPRVTCPGKLYQA